MKKILYILLFVPLFFLSSCEEEEPPSGYDCILNTCNAVFENPQYLTLSDCQNSCPYNNGGDSNLDIGDIYEGGMIFYIDETGQHGLIAAMEDLEGTYEWGCYQEYVDGADGHDIGSGSQNTMDIISQGCEIENGGASAAQATLDAEINGYSDWCLPSKDELVEMYNTIGYGGPQGNIGGFEYNWYWSSSEYNNNFAWYVVFTFGFTYRNSKYDTGSVRPIRSF